MPRSAKRSYGPRCLVPPPEGHPAPGASPLSGPALKVTEGQVSPGMLGLS